MDSIKISPCIAAFCLWMVCHIKHFNYAFPNLPNTAHFSDIDRLDMIAGAIVRFLNCLF